MSRLPKENTNPSDPEQALDGLLLAYRDALPDPEPSVSFMPGMWARIEAREVSPKWFGRIARALTLTAVAASLVLAMLVSSDSAPSVFFKGNFIDALSDDHVAALEPLHLDRMSQMDRQ